MLEHEQGCSVSTATGYGLRFPTAVRSFLLATASRPTQWVPGTLYPEIKRPKLEDDYSHPSSIEVKNECSRTSTKSFTYLRLHSYGQESSQLTLALVSLVAWGCEDVKRITVTQDRVQWSEPVNTVTKVRVLWKKFEQRRWTEATSHDNARAGTVLSSQRIRNWL